MTREHRAWAYACVEGFDYESSCPDGKAFIDGGEVIGDYAFESSIAQALANAEARGRASRDAEVERLRADFDSLPERLSLSAFVSAGMPLAMASLALMVARRVFEGAETERGGR